MPLIFEAPGDRPHALVITGDVHDKPGDQSQISAAVTMAEIFEREKLPLSYYITGSAADNAAREVKRFHEFTDLEISSHAAGFKGQTYVSSRFPELGSLGILADLRKAHGLLGITEYPKSRHWLISIRNHGWASDQGAWHSLWHEGIGLVFDDVADRLPVGSPYQLPEVWFSGGETERLQIPVFEKNVITGKRPFPSGSFVIPSKQRDDIASLPSA